MIPFFFHFDGAVLPVSTFLEGIPANLRTFSGGRIAPDPAGIASRPASVSAFSTLQSKDLGAGYKYSCVPNLDNHWGFQCG